MKFQPPNNRPLQKMEAEEIKEAAMAFAEVLPLVEPRGYGV